MLQYEEVEYVHNDAVNVDVQAEAMAGDQACGEEAEAKPGEVDKKGRRVDGGKAGVEMRSCGCELQESWMNWIRGSAE